MTTRQIFFVGTGLAGKHTALRFLAKVPAVVGGHRYLVSKEFAHDSVLSGAVSSLRAKFFYDPRAVPSNPALRREIAEVVESDGFVFVIDSQDIRLEGNREALACLRQELQSAGRDLDDVPTVFLANKRDLPNALPVPALKSEFTTRRSSFVESVAIAGIGLPEAVAALDRLITG